MALKTTPTKSKSKKEHNINNNELQPSLKTKDRTTIKSKKTKPSFKQTSSIPLNPIVNPYTPATVMTIPTVYPQYQHYSYPIAFNEWSPIIPANPLYAVPLIPIILNPPAVFSTQICPYPPLPIPPIIPSPIILSSNTSPISSFYEPGVDVQLESPVESCYGSEVTCGCEIYETVANGVEENVLEKLEAEDQDPIGYYLSLPKDLFPSARMMTLDPNQLIDEFCRLSNVNNQAPWILDLEFGIPKSPITRPIPTYDVKFNSIHCKNTPDAIHPGFECCSEEFKQILLFYYDCIVSSWYRGYVCFYSDISVENFQNWLQLPMQLLGMSWS